MARAESGPLVASHAARPALCQASRNLTDRQLDAIGDSDGLVGIVYACPFLRADFADDADTPLELIAQHAAYVAERIGVEHVALGSDFDGATIPAALGDVPGCQGSWRHSAVSASATTRSTRLPGTTGAACSGPGGGSPGAGRGFCAAPWVSRRPALPGRLMA